MELISPYLTGIAILVAVVFILWLPTRIDYRVTARDFRITLLGIPLRRIPIGDIDHITTHHERWAEQWWNTCQPLRRRLMIVRRRGWIRNLVVTPRYRYELKAALEKAMDLHSRP